MNNSSPISQMHLAGLYQSLQNARYMSRCLVCLIHHKDMTQLDCPDQG